MKPNDKAIEAAIRYLKAPMSAREQMEQILTAAYAAQFQSEDYDALLKSLHANAAISQTESENQLDEHGVNSTLYIAAADALEAVLAERDTVRKELIDEIKRLDRERIAWKKQQEETAALLKQVEAERDALAACLAPVDDDILQEIAAMHFARIDGHSDNWDRYVDEAKDYIDAIRPHIEAAERERCAKIAEARLRTVIDLPDGYINGWEQCQRSIAAAIRSWKS